MSRFTLLYVLLPLPLLLVCSACTIYIGPYDESSGSGAQLPEPNEGAVDVPLLDEAQRARKEEADRYILEVIYQGGTIVKAIQLPSGDVVDFVDRETLPALPYELPPLPFAPEDVALPPGVELGLSELEQISELVALAATATPFHRPMFWPYILGETDAISIEDYLDRYQMGGEPVSEERLHAGLQSLKPNRGVSGFMNQFRPQVEPGSLSLLEFAVACPAEPPVQEMIGVAISVDKANAFSKNTNAVLDGEPRLHIEHARLNPTTGQVEFKWDGVGGAFKPNPLRVKYHPGEKVPVSMLGGAQVEHLIAIFQAPVTGDWWIAYQNELLGYFPAGLFTMLSSGACVSLWYGEVAWRKPAKATGWVKTEMGSGKFADAGLLHAAYVRNPTYYDLSWFGIEPPDQFISAPFFNKDCYSRTPKENRIFFLGGPGGNHPGCVAP
jgi:hypothetical protein